MLGDSSQDVFSGRRNQIMRDPKLELQSAPLAARLRRKICRAITVTVDKVFMWTVSTIFFANRVFEIPENTSDDQWNHVATCDNPADAGTRGMSAEVLQSSSWVRGPDI